MVEWNTSGRPLRLRANLHVDSAEDLLNMHDVACRAKRVRQTGR